MMERFCGNCAHEGSGSISCAHCDDGYSGWTPLGDPVARWRSTARRMAHDARGWRRQAETDAETVEECKARMEIQAGEIGRLKATARTMAREAREWRGAMEDLDTYDGNAAVCIRDQFESIHRLRGILREAASILANATETHHDYAGTEAVAALAQVAAQVIRLQDETIADRDAEIARLERAIAWEREVVVPDLVSERDARGAILDNGCTLLLKAMGTYEPGPGRPMWIYTMRDASETIARLRRVMEDL